MTATTTPNTSSRGVGVVTLGAPGAEGSRVGVGVLVCVGVGDVGVKVGPRPTSAGTVTRAGRGDHNASRRGARPAHDGPYTRMADRQRHSGTCDLSPLDDP